VASAPVDAMVVEPVHVTDAVNDSPQALVFYDGKDGPATRLAMDTRVAVPGVVQLVDLRTAAAVDALRTSNADPKWATLLAEGGVESFRAEGGALMLVRPEGGVLPHAEREQWMLDYELQYLQSVQPASAAVQERIQQRMLAPLDIIRTSAPVGTQQPWWGTQAAIDVWGPALAENSFLVFDDFLPRAAALELEGAMQRLKERMERGLTDSQLSARGRGDRIAWVNPGELQELGPLVESLNALVGGMMELPLPDVQARLQGISALSDAQFAVFPGDTAECGDARYIRHSDNEDGRNGRLLTCTYYLNEGWDAAQHGGELRLFEPDKRTIKLDVAPVFNRVAVFFSDHAVPHEVRPTRRERHAITIWYLDQEKHLAYHADNGQ